MQNFECRLRPSVYYLLFSGTTFVLSLMIIFYLPITWIAKIGLFLAVVFYHWNLLREIMLWKRSSVINLKRKAGREWLIKTKSTAFASVLHPTSYVSELFCVLIFMPKSDENVSALRLNKVSCSITKDSLHESTYRNLLVILKCS